MAFSYNISGGNSGGMGSEGRSRPGIQYPSPFFDIGTTYLPPDMRSLFQWCRYYFYTNPIIAAAVTKMATFPVTEILFESESEGLEEFWDDLLLKKLGLRKFLYELGMDYFCYGNAYAGIILPFRKHLVCPGCKLSRHVADVKYKFRNFKFEASCPKCGFQGEHKQNDASIRSKERIRLVRWHPGQVEPENNLFSKPRYKYYLNPGMRNDIVMGKRSVIETVPSSFIEAAKKPTHGVYLNKVFHFARPSISDPQESYANNGIPLIFPVLKDTYYLQMLRKAQEMIAQEHIVPLRVLFPAPSSNAVDPFSTINMLQWTDRVESELERWKWDPNHMPVFPIPIGTQVMGGDGRALMLHQELRLVHELVLAGMLVPPEFVFGGVSYGGTSLSMNAMKQQFDTYRQSIWEMIQYFLIEELSTYLHEPPITARLKRFHMADDLQRVALSFQFNQAGKLSDETLLKEMDYDSAEEQKKIQKESLQQLETMSDQQISQAHVQGEAMKLQGRYQNQMMQEQQGAEVQPEHGVTDERGPVPTTGAVPAMEPMLDLESTARQLANDLSGMEDSAMFDQLKLMTGYPELKNKVLGYLNGMRGGGGATGTMLPMNKAPRRPMGENLVQ